MQRAISWFVITVSFLLVLPKTIHAVETGWAIESFTSQITVHENSQVLVYETIVVDFETSQKHGILRTIPVDYRDRYGNKLNIRFELVSVTDELGNERPTATKRRKNEVELKIGDPQKTVSGIQTYVIRYSVDRVITRFEDHDELYWNVTGDDWPVTIRKAAAGVQLPEKVKDTLCFSARSGSNLQNCTVETQERQATFSSDTPIYPGEGLTIVLAIPKGAVAMPRASLQIWWFLADNWPYAIPLASAFVLLWFYWQHGRDDQYRSMFDPSQGTEKLPVLTAELIPSAYAPLKDMKPAEAGTLIDEEVNIRDIAATIVDLAVRGYVRIEEISTGKYLKKSDFKLVWTNLDTSNLEEFESLLLLALFGKASTDMTVKLSDLKYKFHTHLGKIRDSLYEDMWKKDYVHHRPDKVVRTYRIIGAVIAFLGFWLFAISLAWTVAAVGTGLMIALSSKAMPKRTAKGRKQYLRVLGLRNFINIGAYRQQLWEKSNLFEEVMPYAIALNLTHKWAEVFEKVSIAQPDWYSGTRPFNPAMFSYSMEDFTRATTQTLPATRSAASGSSGFSGGSSGGGFGGGGGGSW